MLEQTKEVIKIPNEYISLLLERQELKGILSMVLKRYVLPKNRRTYIEIFTNNLIEGIES